ncbi:hypothetical protein [Flocculibacter collagenilyticus]|uniref:hypothetical protein n=1 Tax=Flocculibacter collagenilyticus TaxID=2744479 RepID=UPI0018F3C898|nr:hypothetical protein [Flocculibacter collagenilyticus]
MLIDKFSSFILKFFCGYFDGNINRFVEQKSKLILNSEENNRPPLVLIVSREFYAEEHIIYPVDNISDAKKMIALEKADVSNNIYIYYKLNNSSIHVLVYSFQDNVPHSLIRIPESQLIGKTLENNYILEIEVSTNNSYFITKVNSTIVSACKTPLLNSTMKFAASVNLNESAEANTVTKECIFQFFKSAILSSLKESCVQGVVSFYKERKQKLFKTVTFSLLIPIIFITALYIGLTSIFLFLYEDKLYYESAQIDEEVINLVAVKSNLDNKLKKAALYNEFIESQNRTALVWLIVKEHASYVQYTNVRFSNQRFIIRGKTKSATELLTKLSANQQVVDAKFDYPTRKSRGEEYFVISLIINEIN